MVVDVLVVATSRDVVDAGSGADVDTPPIEVEHATANRAITASSHVDRIRQRLRTQKIYMPYSGQETRAKTQSVTTIRNGRLAIDGELVPADLHVTDGIIARQSDDGEGIDATGLIVSPGFIDLQINGGFGYDFTRDPTTIWEVGSRLPQFGVTSFLPTIVTSPREVTELALQVVADGPPHDYTGADVLGLHFEGPWIFPDKHGAHNPLHIVEPDPAVARQWAESGLVRVVTLAPEIPGADEVGRILAASAVVISVGHSNASFEIARKYLSTTATLVTHLFNQMSPLTHREPGVVGASLLSEHPAGLIVDGIHIIDGALELAWRLLGRDRTILVTDAMAALGLGPGTYQLGDASVTVGADGPRTMDGRLGGSTLTLPQAVANLTATTGAGTAEAILGATANPARVLGLADRGHLRPGGRADLVFLDPDLKPVTTLVAPKM
ncbi:MAG TPA: N-acetylglucosamine-6-phosphate deacetylase [Acidimicrobiia bacterium]|nr:N-acetylglucosamine-6-phosphate deacetylase [Acidimicrobiia bacterium]